MAVLTIKPSIDTTVALTPFGTIPSGTIASYPKSNYNAYTTLYSGYCDRFAQSITLAACTIKSVKVYLQKIGDPSGSVTVNLKAVTGTVGTDATPDGAALAAVAMATSEISDLALYEFVFSSPYAHAGGNIAIEIEYAGGNSTNKIRTGQDNTGEDAGNSAVYVPSQYYPDSGSNDVIYYINGMIISL